MAVVTRPLQNTRGLSIMDYSSTMGDSLRAAAGDAFASNPIANIDSLVWQASEAASQGAPFQMSPEEANSTYGDLGLKFDKPVSPEYAKHLADQKSASIDRQKTIERGPQGTLPGAARFLAGFGASAVDPINVASAFIPVVGEARAAALTSSLGKTAARALTGAAEGAVGAVALEPLNYAGANARQDEYGLSDSFTNIVFGTALGGGLHTAIGAIGDRWEARKVKAMGETGAKPMPSNLAEAIDNLPAGAREENLRLAVGQDALGDDVNVEPFVRDQIPEHLRDYENMKYHFDEDGTISREVPTSDFQNLDGTERGRPISMADLDGLQSQELAAANPSVAETIAQIQKAPAAPKVETLTQWLKKQGGLIDDAGELKGMDANKQVVGLISNKKGKRLDDMALAAQEAGFIGKPDSYDARATRNDLLDAIREDLRSKSIVREPDRQTLSDHAATSKYNDEFAAYLSDNDIDVQGKSISDIMTEMHSKGLIDAPGAFGDIDRSNVDYSGFQKKEITNSPSKFIPDEQNVVMRASTLPDDITKALEELEKLVDVERKAGNLSESDIATLDQADNLIEQADALERGILDAATCIYRRT